MITSEDRVWNSIHADHLWVLDKLILSRKLNYVCGPVGLAVPKPDYYIVRPCVNMLGLGLGASCVWIDSDTTHLPLGHFWCEWFEGRHLSVDYHWGKQVLAVEGHKPHNTFIRWNHWARVTDTIELPEILNEFANTYQWINCEFIGEKLIEVHFRKNEDFDETTVHFIPVWQGQNTQAPKGYTYKEYPDVHGRIGAFVKRFDD
jgi:hypothetical protein